MEEPSKEDAFAAVWSGTVTGFTHPRDTHVEYFEDDELGVHLYLVSPPGEPARLAQVSVTGLVGRLCPREFVAATEATRLSEHPTPAYCVRGASGVPLKDARGGLVPLARDVILQQWKDANAAGKALHGLAEDLVRGRAPGTVPAGDVNEHTWPALVAWHTARVAQGWVPLVAEWSLWGVTAAGATVAGRVDAVYVHPTTRRVLVVDFKRCKHSTRGFWEGAGTRCAAPFEDLPDSKATKWRLQVGIYVHLLTSRYGVAQEAVAGVAVAVEPPGPGGCAATATEIALEPVPGLGEWVEAWEPRE